MTHNTAVLAGFTEEYLAMAPDVDLHLLVRPGTDLDTTFKAWDCDEQGYVLVHGWLFEFAELLSDVVPSCGPMIGHPRGWECVPSGLEA